MTQAELLEREEQDYSAVAFPPPRAHQVSAHADLRDGYRDGHHKQMLVAATGAGKTYLGLRAVYEALAKGRRALFVCDRTALINQTSATADAYGLTDHGIIQADHWRTNRHARFQIASVQTLERRTWPQADVIIIDEAHCQYKTWVEHVKATKSAVIGLSATPFSAGLGKIFTNLVNAGTMHELTEAGVLVPMRVFSCAKPDMDGAETSGGEWTAGAAGERSMAIIGDVVAEWQKHASERKTIVFGATIAHCGEIVRQFNESGVMAACFTSETRREDREALLAEYRKPDSALRVLVSVEALAKGFDVPDVGCVCDCRPLRKSLSTFIQMAGRGLRSSPSTGKTDCILLDFSGNVIRFADDFADLYFHGVRSLDEGAKLDKTVRKDEEREPATCPECGYSPCGKRCVSCGHERVKKSLIEHEAGELIEVDFRSSKGGKIDKAQVWAESVSLCRFQGNQATAKNRAAHLYRSITGVWPRNLPDFNATPTVEVSRAVMNKATANAIAYRARQA